MISDEFERKYNFSAIGIDEAGRGPIAGPVVASAVLFCPNIPKDVNDSKKISETKRAILYEKIINVCKVGVGIASASEIDELNILRATEIAMQRAYTNLNETASGILVDGNTRFLITESQEVHPIIGGDSKSITIAAASIVAKVVRDKIMYDLHLEYPEYKFDKHKGYPTKLHLELLEKYGHIPKIHRKTFGPVKNIIHQIA